MSKTLLESVTSQLLLRSEAGALSTEQLIQILENQSRPQVRYVPQGSVTGVTQEEATDFMAKVSNEQEEQRDVNVEEECKMTATQLAKKEISEQIIALDGTPPEKGSLAKFKEALADLKEEEETQEEEEETQEYIDRFNDEITKLQNTYDKLEAADKVQDQNIIFELMKDIDEDAKSPDQLTVANIKKLNKALKKHAKKKK